MPTREEIEAAAKRLKETYDSPNVCHMDEHVHMVADAYLAEHDPAPITDDALEQAGFVRLDDFGYWVCGYVYATALATGGYIFRTGAQWGSEVNPFPRTIGELRQLLARLES